MPHSNFSEEQRHGGRGSAGDERANGTNAKNNESYAGNDCKAKRRGAKHNR